MKRLEDDLMNHDPFQFNQSIPANGENQQENFQELEATQLYCPNCRQAVPVRRFLLLVLPDGDRYEYRCQYCGTRVGRKTDHSGQYYGILQR